MGFNLNKALIGGPVDSIREGTQKDGAKVANIVVKTSRTYTKSDGTEGGSKTSHKLTIYGKLAELVLQHIKPGTEIYIEGRFNNRSWKTPDGETKFETEVIVEKLELLSEKQKSEKPQEEQIPF